MHISAFHPKKVTISRVSKIDPDYYWSEQLRRTITIEESDGSTLIITLFGSSTELENISLEPTELCDTLPEALKRQAD